MNRKKLKFELKKRSKDELEFEDEVDYPADILCKDRFKKYKGLKNFKTSEWKKTVFLMGNMISKGFLGWASS